MTQLLCVALLCFIPAVLGLAPPAVAPPARPVGLPAAATATQPASRAAAAPAASATLADGGHLRGHRLGRPPTSSVAYSASWQRAEAEAELTEVLSSTAAEPSVFGPHADGKTVFQGAESWTRFKSVPVLLLLLPVAVAAAVAWLRSVGSQRRVSGSLPMVSPPTVVLEMKAVQHSVVEQVRFEPQKFAVAALTGESSKDEPKSPSIRASTSPRTSQGSPRSLTACNAASPSSPASTSSIKLQGSPRSLSTRSYASPNVARGSRASTLQGSPRSLTTRSATLDSTIFKAERALKKMEPKLTENPSVNKAKKFLESAVGRSLATPKPQLAGNLVQYMDTWRIHRPGQKLPEDAKVSDCSVEPSLSEYADETASNASAWVSRSVIPFAYRVVEVPQNRLLDPSCDALIFGHLAHGSEERAAAMARPQRRLVVIDETVNNLYGERVKEYFEARGVDHEILALPMTEEHKSMDLALKVAKKMKDFNIDRRTEPVLAIGGGVCLDVVGLAAAMFRRRTPYIRVPTTTLSYVDASVGAKNGVNFGNSKNRLGTYVPPCAALLDSCFFETQTHREVANGVAEMAKMAIMKSPELYELLERNGPSLVANKFAPRFEGDIAPARVLQLSIETMLEELAPNLWEHSLDRLVDFGHAVGQDLEMAALGTESELMHGESVAVDMALMTVLAQRLGLISEDERDRTLMMLRRCQVPIWSPVMTYDLFAEAVANRVKNSMGQRFPLPAGIGEGRIMNDVGEEDLRSAFELWNKLCRTDGRA